jgi:hypothetical protein
LTKTYSATNAYAAFTQEAFEAGYLVGVLSSVGLMVDPEPSSEFQAALARFVESDPDTHRARERLSEIVLQHLVDQYLIYVTDLLAEIFRERPEMLYALIERKRGDEPPSVALETVFQHDSIEELRGSIIHRRVDELSRKSMSELER